MTTNDEAALAGTASDDTHATKDFITVVSSVRKPDKRYIRLTKKIMADGQILGYEDASTHTTSKRSVNGIRCIHRVIGELQSCPNKAVIRGRFVGAENVKPEHNANQDGKPLGQRKYRRNSHNFPDTPHHWMMLDVDAYAACLADPVKNPEAAAREFIEAELPEYFHGASFVWQLSASAGTPGREHQLKIHLWFWLADAWDSASLRIWAEAINAKKNQKLLDPSVYQPVQLHYCSAPVLDEGVADPVPERMGMWESPDGRDEVKLEITADMRSNAEKVRNASPALEFKDQSTKPGHVGLFYRTYDDWNDIVFEILEDEFEEGSAEGRLTWLSADSGTPDGAWVAGPYCHHIGASHNSWPWGANRVTTLFDCVRHFNFGHLDDELERFDREQLADYELPSYKALCDWMDKHPAVQAQREREEAAERPKTQSDLTEHSDEDEERSPFLSTLTLAELMRLPQPEWLVKGVLARDSMALIYGPSSVGKTFSVIDIAMAIARGTGDWFGRKAKAGGVLYIAGEGARGLVNRMAAYCQHHGVDPKTVPANFCTEALNLLDEEQAKRAYKTFKGLKTQGRTPALVVIDTLAATMIGGDESSAQDMTSYLEAAKEIRQITGACVLIIHHTGKDESRGARGSSSLRAAVDTEISITETGGVRSMKITKQRDGIAGVAIGYTLETVNLGIDEDLDYITSCVVKPADVPEQASTKPLGANQRIVMDTIRELSGGIRMAPTSVEEVIKAALPRMESKPGKKDRRRELVKQALASLAESGNIRVDAEGVITVPF